MQTYLPFHSAAESARVLDYKRLGNQRLETRQISTVLSQGPLTLYRLPRFKRDPDARYIYGPVPAVVPAGHEIRTTPWWNHPAVQMWRSHPRELLYYGLTICTEWRARGYRDTLLDWFRAKLGPLYTLPAYWTVPAHFTDQFHAAHRSNLLRKDPDWYGRLGWTEPVDLPYVWPRAALGDRPISLSR